MKRNVVAVVWLCVVMVSLNVNANVIGPDIDGDIVVWEAGETIYWDDLRDGQGVNSVSSYTDAGSPSVHEGVIVFEYGSTPDLGGFDIDEPSWQFPGGPNNANKQRYPEKSGCRVVWVEYNDTTDRDIYMIDLTTLAITPVCNDPSRQTSPAIDGDIVVWQDRRTDNTYQIYWCNVSGELLTPQPVNATGDEQLAPDVSGDLVVWAEDRTEQAGQNDTGIDIYGYDLAQGAEFPICIDTGDQTQPSVCGQLVVWQDNNTPDDDYDIRVYDRQTGQTQTVVSDSGNQQYPAISGRTIVWQNDDVSVGYTTMAEPTDITLIAPEPNEIVLADSQALIDWTVEGPVEQVQIEFSPNNGQSWQMLEPNVPADAPYLADVPNIDSTECMIRVSNYDNTDVSDTLDGTFTIFQCDENLTADITGDCFVGLDDFAEMAAQWLTCGNPYDATWCEN